MNAPAVNPPLKWHGGKTYMARHIHALAKQTTYTHRVITHAGGLGELWDWDYEGISEVVNDINGWLINFWNVLRDPIQFEGLRRFLEATPFAEPVFDAAKDVMGKTPLAPTGLEPVTAAAWFFICCRQSLAGRMKGFASISRNRVRRGMNEQCSAWLTAIEGLPDVHARLKRVLVLNQDALEVVRSEDTPNTLFYLDPPYMPDARSSPDVYAYEMTPAQHEELLLALGRIEGRFILSGYDCGMYCQFEELHQWRRQEIELPNNSAGGAAKRRMKEVLWFNF